MAMNQLQKCLKLTGHNLVPINRTDIVKCCLAKDDPVLKMWLLPLVWTGLSVSLVYTIVVLLYTWYLAWWTDKHMCDLHPHEIIVDENPDEDEDEYDNGDDIMKLRSRQSFADLYDVVPDDIVIRNTKTERRGSLFPQIDQMEGIDEEESSMDEQDTTEEEHLDKDNEYEASLRSSMSAPSVIANDERGDSVEITIPERYSQTKEDTDMEDYDSRRDSGETTDGQSIVNSDEDKTEKKSNEKERNEDRPAHSPRRRKYRTRNSNSNESKKFAGQYTLPVRDGKLQRTHSQHAAYQILQLMANPEEFNNEKEEEPPEKVKTPSPRKFSMDVFAQGRMFNGQHSPRPSLGPTSEKFDRSHSDYGHSSETSPTDHNSRDAKPEKKFSTVKAIPSHIKPSIQFFNFNSLPRKAKKMSTATPITPSDRARKASTESQRNLSQEDFSSGGRAVPRGQGDRSGSMGYNPQRRSGVTFDRVVDVADV